MILNHFSVSFTDESKTPKRVIYDESKGKVIEDLGHQFNKKDKIPVSKRCFLVENRLSTHVC